MDENVTALFFELLHESINYETHWELSLKEKREKSYPDIALMVATVMRNLCACPFHDSFLPRLASCQGISSFHEICMFCHLVRHVHA